MEEQPVTFQQLSTRTGYLLVLGALLGVASGIVLGLALSLMVAVRVGLTCPQCVVHGL
jgi:uncharacterized protein involved in exopolysaccharide biosynthesis